MKGIANGIADSLDVAFTYEPIQKSFLHPYQAVKAVSYTHLDVYKRQRTVSMTSFSLEVRSTGSFFNPVRRLRRIKFAEFRKFFAR